MVAQADDVPRLLAADEPSFALERLEHVPVADVGRDDTDAALAHQCVEPEVRHHGDRDQVDAEVERQDRDDLVAVDQRAVSSTASMRSPSPSKAMPRSKLPATTSCCRSPMSVAPQPTLMF